MLGSLLLVGFPFRVEEGSWVFLVVLDTCPGMLLSARRDLLLPNVSLKVFFLLLEETVCMLAQLMSLSGVTMTTRLSVLSSSSTLWFFEVVR